MTKRGLPPEEIKRRLIHLRNVEYLHEVQRFKIWFLRDEIRGEPGVHLDETSWKLLQGGDTSYAWVMSGVESKESVFNRA